MDYKATKIKQISYSKRNNRDLPAQEYIFTKDTVKYGVEIRFPDGAFLINYYDEQYPIIPFAFEDYVIDYLNNNQQNNDIIDNNQRMKINLLDKGRLDAKIRNNELRGDIDYSKFKSQIDELKKNSLYLNLKIIEK